MHEFHFERPVQTVRAVQEATGIHRMTIQQAARNGLLGNAAYRSGDIWLIDTAHIDFQKWYDAHWQQARVKGKGKQA